MEFLTAEEVAKILKVSPWFVYKHAKSLGGLKIGRCVRFPKELFEKRIQEVIEGDRLQTSGEMAVRVHDQGRALPGQRVRNQASRPRRRSRRSTELKEDEFSILALMRESLEGFENEEDEEISQGKRQAHQKSHQTLEGEENCPQSGCG